MKRSSGKPHRSFVDRLESRRYMFVSADSVLSSNPTFRTQLRDAFTTTFRSNLDTAINSGTYSGTYEQKFDEALKALMKVSPGTGYRTSNSPTGLYGKFFVSLGTLAARATEVTSGDASNPNYQLDDIDADGNLVIDPNERGDKTLAARYNYASGATVSGRYDDSAAGENFININTADWYRFTLNGSVAVLDATAFDLTSLNRFSHWADMARAYQYTGNTDYVNTIVRELGDWSSRVSPTDLTSQSDTAPNGWSYTNGNSTPASATTFAGAGSTTVGAERLDAAERAANWAWTYPLVVQSSKWTAAANTLFLYQALIHGRYLSNSNLATANNGWGFGSGNNNKMIMGTQGLLYLSILFPELSEASAWNDRAHDMLFTKWNGNAGDSSSVLVTAFYDDGGSKEQSAVYQQKQVEDVLQMLKLDAINYTSNSPWDVAQSAGVITATELVARAVGNYYNQLQPDGRRHPIGNATRSGSVATAVMGDRVLGTSLAPANYLQSDDIWHLGDSSTNNLNTNIPKGRTYANSGPGSGAWDSGNYIFRSGSTVSRTAETSTDKPTRDRQVLFRGGDRDSTPDWPFSSAGEGPHTHDDLMGIDYVAYGRGVFPDPGGKDSDDDAANHNLMTVSSGTYNRANDNPRTWNSSNPNDKIIARSTWVNETDRSGGRDYIQSTAWNDEWKYISSNAGSGSPPSGANSIVARSVWTLNSAMDTLNASNSLYGTTVVVDWGEALNLSNQNYTVRFNTHVNWDAGSSTFVPHTDNFLEHIANGTYSRVEYIPLSGPAVTRRLEKTTIKDGVSDGDKKTFSVTATGEKALFAHVLTSWQSASTGISGVTAVKPNVSAQWIDSIISSTDRECTLRVSYTSPAGTLSMWNITVVVPNTDMSANTLPTFAAGTQVPAKKFGKTQGLVVQAGDGDDVLGSFDNGDYVRLENVNLGTSANQVTLRYAAGAASSGKKLEFRLNSPTGTKIAEYVPVGTGGWSTYATTTQAFLSGVTASGLHDIYVVGASNATGIANLKWIQFGTGSPLIAQPPMAAPRDGTRISEDVLGFDHETVF